MLTNWIIFGASALVILKIGKMVNTIMLCKRVTKRYTEEDLNKEIMERNNRMMEEARKKGVAA